MRTQSGRTLHMRASGDRRVHRRTPSKDRRVHMKDPSVLASVHQNQDGPQSILDMARHTSKAEGQLTKDNTC